MAEAGRYKLGPDGAYYDPNDIGPNQASPEQIAALQGQQAPAPEAPDSISGPSSPIPNSGISGYGSYGGATGSPVPAPQPATGAPTSPAPWQQTPSPAGFDATKWNDPNKSDPKYDIGHMVASGMSNDQIGQYLAQKYPGYTIAGKDTIRDPQGNIYDFRFDQEGANKPMWEGVGGPGFSGSGGIGGQVSGMTPGATGTAGAGNSAFSDQVRQLLMQQLGGLTGPLTANDPQIKAEMDAQGNVLERNRRDRRAADAERAAMNGLLNGGQSSGSFEQNVASGFEDKGQQLTGIQAQLFTRELQSRRSYVQNLLAQAMQSGDAESARNLQFTLAQMDDVIRRMSLAQNQSQFNDQFGLQAGQFQYQKDRDLANYGAGY